MTTGCCDSRLLCARGTLMSGNPLAYGHAGTAPDIHFMLTRARDAGFLNFSAQKHFIFTECLSRATKKRRSTVTFPSVRFSRFVQT